MEDMDNNYTNHDGYLNTEHGQSNKKKNGKKNRSCGAFFKKAIAFTLCGALFGAAAGGSFTLVENIFSKDKDKNTEVSVDVEENKDDVTEESTEATQDAEEVVDNGTEIIPATTTLADGDIDSQSLDVSDIAENVMPSVVAITIKAVTEYDFGVFGGTYEYESEGSGSGIIIDTNESELLMVTNNHVVSGAETVSVCFIDGAVYEANVKGTDVDNDLAVISVDLKDISDETMNSIKIATIGNSDELKVGEQVVAIGNALGYGQSVTTGIVSAKDRIVSTNTTPLIQTDAAINPGNSGGALLNMRGEVVGINSSKYASTEVEGMGYAIPISAVESILEELMNQETKEKVPEERRGYLGISCQTIDSTTAAIYNVPVGAYITEFSDKSAAEAAGMELESIIVKFDGQSISSAEELVALLEYYEKGTEVEVVAMIDDDGFYIEKTYSVVLGSQPKTED